MESFYLITSFKQEVLFSPLIWLHTCLLYKIVIYEIIYEIIIGKRYKY